jgi:hypothetical protein
MENRWLDRKVSFYSSQYDNFGEPMTLREILFSLPDKDLETVRAIRNLDRSESGYELTKRKLKNGLRCYTPSALLSTKIKGRVTEVHRTGIMQLDFDCGGIKGYDIEELKRKIFELDFIGYCGLSCSGDGFYALALIADPTRLSEYATQCFLAFESYYGIIPDKSKGKKPENLRYVSYDANVLWREDPQPLRIRRFYQEQSKNRLNHTTNWSPVDHPTHIHNLLSEIKNAKKGHRYTTVQRVAYSLGGYGRPEYFNSIIDAIRINLAFTGEEDKYQKCAMACFRDGLAKPYVQNRL